MITFRTLENTSIDMIHEAFLLAFSDYQVPMVITKEALIEMLIRRGYDASKSMGAFDGEQLVGFVLNGSRDWQGKTAAYDTGTGVIPTHRRQKITSRMMEALLDHLRNSGHQSYVLEVLQENHGAISLYELQGFQKTRTLYCLRLQLAMHDNILHLPSHTNPKQKHMVLYWDEMMPALIDQFQTFWDTNPSWQNSMHSIMSLPEAFKIGFVMHEGVLAGYGIIHPKSGDIPQIAVHKDHRRKGIGSSILAGLIEQTEHGKASVMNVDEDCESLLAFLHYHDFHHVVSQYEMIRFL